MAPFLKVTNEAFRLKLNFDTEIPPDLQRLTAARRDHAAFQLILQSDLQYSVNTGHSDWFSSKGRLAGPHERLRVAVEAPFPVKMNPEEFVTDDDGVEKADILLEQDVRESRANVPSAVWIELEIPEDAIPGDYPVTVHLYSSRYFEDETPVQSKTVMLTVASTVLPAPQDWKFYLDLWQHSSNIARKHDVPLWSEAHFSVLKQYAASLAALGQKSITVIASEIPWNGQSCQEDHEYKGNLFEYSMIRITRRTDGRFTYDYSPMQRYIDLCTDAGICGDIEVFGIVNVWSDPGLAAKCPCPDYPEAIRLRYLDEADGCMKYVRDASAIHDYVRALEDYFIRTGQISRVRIAADEPVDLEKYRHSLTLLQELAPNFRCKTAINHAEFIEEFHDRIDDFVPYLRCTVVEYDRLMRYRREYPEKKFLWYVCCGGASPNTFLRTPPIECRMIGILTSALRMDGFLRWNYTVWPDDPRREIRYSAFEAGDTNFVYPANNGGALLSLRYKNLQRGIADYELLEQLRTLRGDRAVNAVLKNVLFAPGVQDFWQEKALLPSEKLFSLNWEDYNRTKAELLRALQA
ncbi:MAG: glycoside hydrolase domain-containing protein [Acutalibacteraceae bacterium]|jgi:hypothetical protein